MIDRDPAAALEPVRAYHALSKHRPDRYAPGPGHLDWANQPDPFRRFAGCETVALPLLADRPSPRFAALAQPPQTPAVLDRAGVAQLFELALGLSAWKAAGPSRWALRCNPSSGNLHPTEGYLVCPGLPDLAPGLYHYDSYRHCLERRAALAADEHWRAACAGNLLVGLSGIHWREAWKYGARAWRYCQHDAGHAIGALRYAAATLGWGARLLTAPGDAEIAALLGLDRSADFLGAEPEAAELLLVIGPRPGAADPGAQLTPPPSAVWQGRANRLSSAQVDWPQIGAVAAATGKPRSAPCSEPPLPLPPPAATAGDMSAVDLIRRRRSAVAFDGRTRMPAQAFFALLDALLPRADRAPWDVLPWQPRIHPVLFVHRVEGLAAGLYALPRSPAAADRLRGALSAEFGWEPVAGAPAQLPLHRLLAGDSRDLARALACHQDIAADSCFALAMLGDFEASLARGPHWYRWLFWEAGLLGQVLYLQAEALGLRGTGIGCYFDDAVHQVLGLADDRWQDLYHFTVGSPVEDQRLRTEPPYAHLGDRGHA
ncbi:MAG: hypothetical protein RLZ44_1377 [Pseudomonadota bacterium]